MPKTPQPPRAQQAAVPAAAPNAASLCPLCGMANGCAMSAGADPASCWCMQSAIAPAALAQANGLRPAGTPASQCICPACGAVTDATQG